MCKNVQKVTVTIEIQEKRKLEHHKNCKVKKRIKKSEKSKRNKDYIRLLGRHRRQETDTNHHL